MKDVTKQRGLIKRGDVYWHRVFVPKDLREAYGRGEISGSLRTKDKSEAVSKAKQREAKYDLDFSEKRRALKGGTPLPATPTLSDAQIQALANKHYGSRVADAPIQRRALLKRARAEADAFWRGDIVPVPNDATTYRGAPYSYWTDVCPDLPLDDAFLYAVGFDNRERLEALKRAVALGDCDEFLLRAASLAPDAGADAKERLALALLGAELRAVQAIIKGDPALPAQVGAPVMAQARVPLPVGPDNPLLSTVIDAWLDEKRRRKRPPRVKTLRAYQSAVELFIEIVGDKPISDYTRNDMRAFKDKLTKLPVHRMKKPETKDVSIDQAIRIATERGMKLLDTDTVNDRLSECFNCFDYLANNYDVVTQNPFDGARILDESDPRADRDPFEIDELNRMFSDARYVSDLGRDTPHYWVPLLGLFTGGRANELCKLKANDVDEEDGVWRIDLNEEDYKEAKVSARLKSLNGKRRIPIHVQLIELGFLDFVAAQKRAGVERLFPGLPTDVDGKLQRRVGDNFNAWLKQIGIKRPKLDFHSFRHNFTDACDNAGIPDHITLRLKGEARPGQQNRYGKGRTDLQMLAAEVAKITYKGLDLSHLKPASASSGDVRKAETVDAAQ